jgi:hypothetical protein
MGRLIWQVCIELDDGSEIMYEEVTHFNEDTKAFRLYRGTQLLGLFKKCDVQTFLAEASIEYFL